MICSNSQSEFSHNQAHPDEWATMVSEERRRRSVTPQVKAGITLSILIEKLFQFGEEAFSLGE